MQNTLKTREKGVALLLAMLSLLLITAVAFGAIYVSTTEDSINNNFKTEETEYFAARAGVEEARNRLVSNSLDQSGNSITLTSPTLPTATPDGGGKVLYILNGVTLAQVTTPPTAGSPNPYFDDELCHDVPGGAGGIVSTPQNVRCTTTLPSTSITTTPSIAPYALDYKWVRVMLKENGSGAYPVAASPVTNPVCYDGSQLSEVTTTSVANCNQAGSLPNASPVYLVTSLAVSGNGKTRRLVQEELALYVKYNPQYSVYGVSTACPAVTFSGNGKTGSFNSSAENPPAEPPSNTNTVSGAPVGTNGGISLSGNASIAGAADVASNPPCYQLSGHPSPPTSTSISPETFPVPPYPNPAPPTSTVAQTTLTPGSWGNVSASGQSTITLQVPDGQGTQANPAIFILNSLSLSGQSSLVISPKDAAACGGSSTCYVQVQIAGAGQNTPLSLTGGSWGNNSGIPATLTFDIAQPPSCASAPCGTVKVSGNGAAYAVINAPAANLQISGNGDIFGQMVGYQVTDSGNGTLWYDNNGANAYNQSAYLYLIAFRELNY
jgi:hypothetical protein